MQAPIAESRFANIDTLRGIAALLVVLQHSAEAFVQFESVAAHGTALVDAANLLDFGRIGIICFFLISGFVVPFSFDDSSATPVKKFATRRFWRLYPAYWLSLVLACSLVFAFGDGLATRTMVANTTMSQSFFGEPHIQGLYWTLEIELIFYALCALLFPYRILTSCNGLAIATGLCLALYTALQVTNKFGPWGEWLREEWRYTPYVLAIMFTGTTVRLAHDQPGNRLAVVYSAVLCLACLSVPVVLMILNAFGYRLSEDPVRFGLGHLLGFALFFCGLVFIRRAKRHLLWLGAISYSLYLLHPVAMSLLLNAVKAFPALGQYHLSIYFLAVAAGGIALASVVYILVERPSISLGRRLSVTAARPNHI